VTAYTIEFKPLLRTLSALFPLDTSPLHWDNAAVISVQPFPEGLPASPVPPASPSSRSCSLEEELSHTPTHSPAFAERERANSREKQADGGAVSESSDSVSVGRSGSTSDAVWWTHDLTLGCVSDEAVRQLLCWSEYLAAGDTLPLRYTVWQVVSSADPDKVCVDVCLCVRDSWIYVQLYVQLYVCVYVCVCVYVYDCWVCASVECVFLSVCLSVCVYVALHISDVLPSVGRSFFRLQQRSTLWIWQSLHCKVGLREIRWWLCSLLFLLWLPFTDLALLNSICFPACTDQGVSLDDVLPLRDEVNLYSVTPPLPINTTHPDELAFVEKYFAKWNRCVLVELVWLVDQHCALAWPFSRCIYICVLPPAIYFVLHLTLTELCVRFPLLLVFSVFSPLS
jgi:hypothetical protein